MAEYTPSTDEIETAFHEFASRLESDEPGTYADAPEFTDWREAMAGFRRWKAENDRQVAAQALREAAADVRARGDVGVEGGPTVERYLTGRAGMLERYAEGDKE